MKKTSIENLIFILNLQYSYHYIMTGFFMRPLTYYWINVFTTEQDQGNPLPVFVLKHPLSTQAMQKIAAMMNQSETVFIENIHSECPRLHIYTPMHPLPFAGHPIIGALQIIQKLNCHTKTQQIEVDAGIVNTDINIQQVHWIQPPAQPSMRQSTLDIPLTSQMLNIPESQILSEPKWLNTGSEQLIVELKDAQAIDAVKIDTILFEKHATLYAGRTMLYLWAKIDNHTIYSRYLYLKNGALNEDSGTGSACANLGGLQVLENNKNLEWEIHQGCLLGRKNILHLKVTDQQIIWIGGQTRFMGKGELFWAD